MLSRYKQALIALYYRVHELSSDPVAKRLLALEIQEELLRRIGHAEYLIRQRREGNKGIKYKLSERSMDRQASRQLQLRYAKGEEKVARQKELISILRAIGDSVAFIFGDRWDLKQLVLHEAPGFISRKRGTRLERKVLRLAFKIGATAVMNDLTHTLRHGDITVFRPDGKFLLAELKSGRGGKRSRTERQQEAGKRIINYLTTDMREAGGGLWTRQSYLEAPTHHFDAITRLALTVPPRGSLVEEVEPGLHYLVIDVAHRQDTFADAFQPLFGKKRTLFMLPPVNELKRRQFAYYPFPLCFNDAEAFFRFYNGEVVLFVMVDMDHVNEVLAQQGLSVRVTGKEEYPWQIVPTADGASWVEPWMRPLYVGWHPIVRLAGEFLRLDWLLKNVVALDRKAMLTAYGTRDLERTKEAILQDSLHARTD
jgi:hypothetical protein